MIPLMHAAACIITQTAGGRTQSTLGVPPLGLAGWMGSGVSAADGFE